MVDVLDANCQGGKRLKGQFKEEPMAEVKCQEANGVGQMYRNRSDEWPKKIVKCICFIFQLCFYSYPCAFLAPNAGTETGYSTRITTTWVGVMRALFLQTSLTSQPPFSCSSNPKLPKRGSKRTKRFLWNWNRICTLIHMPCLHSTPEASTAPPAIYE